MVLNPVPGPVHVSFLEVLQELTSLGPKSSQEAAVVGLERSMWEELVQAGGARRVCKACSLGEEMGQGAVLELGSPALP